MTMMKNQMTKQNDTALIILIKNPELGKAKTRLAATVGDEEALRIYKLLLAHTRSTVLGADVDRFLYYSSHIEDDEWLESDFVKRIQPSGDLGIRMKKAFLDLSKDYEKLIIIGSDCAQLKAEHITKASDLLNDNDVVIGPVHDGGYYLLGMNSYYPELMTDIEWSTASVTAQTKAKAEESKLSLATVETLSDIDYYEDWVKYGLES